MADDSQPPKTPPPKSSAVAKGIGEGLRPVVGVDVNEALSQMASRWHIPKLALLPDESCEEQQEDLQPAAIGEEKKPKPRSKPKRTSLDRIPGRRPMKEYPVTGEELLTLGIMQGGAALMLAFAGTCFGFFLSTQQTIDFAGKEVSQATVGWWEGMGDAALALAIITCLLGIALGVLSGFKVSRIMKNTDHG